MADNIIDADKMLQRLSEEIQEDNMFPMLRVAVLKKGREDVGDALEYFHNLECIIKGAGFFDSQFLDSFDKLHEIVKKYDAILNYYYDESTLSQSELKELKETRKKLMRNIRVAWQSEYDAMEEDADNE